VPAVAAKTEYTCPMHPEVRQDHPGNCPKCGMALEPVTFSVEEKNEADKTTMLIKVNLRHLEEHEIRLTGELSIADLDFKDGVLSAFQWNN